MSSGRRVRPPSKPRNSLATTVTKAAAGIVSFTGLLIAGQALYVFLTTPRLAPPDKSGHDFEEEGIVVTFVESQDDNSEDGKKEDAGSDEGERKNCLNLVLIGDSPVEGIGNNKHPEAMGGRTAQAFSELLRRPVRYWSFGKSGLTAEGIRLEMGPLLQRTIKKYDVDVVVVSCGVNNVLEGSSAANFRKEVNSLIDSIMECCPVSTAIIMLELIDFAHLPFLPWPLSKFLSWRSASLQMEIEASVRDRRKKSHSIEVASYPNIADSLRDSNNSLFDHMEQEEKEALQLGHFYADDNFHPAGHGNIIAGKLLARKYKEMMSTGRFESE